MSYRVVSFLVVILSVSIFLSPKTFLAEEAKSFIYDSKGKRDPFVPLIIREFRSYANLENIETVEDLMLEGVLWDPEGGSIAVLNGVILKEGDLVNNVHILKIAPTKVFLKIDNHEYEVNLQKEEKEGWK